MDREEAIKVLIGAVKIANRRGAFDLSESGQISQAVEALENKEEKQGFFKRGRNK